MCDDYFIYKVVEFLTPKLTIHIIFCLFHQVF